MDKNIQDYNFIRQLQLLPCVKEIWLFGSRARRDHSDRADVDLAIICPDASNDDWNKITNIIEEADTLLKVDCVRFDKELLSQDLYENILKDKKVIYAKKTDQI